MCWTNSLFVFLALVGLCTRVAAVCSSDTDCGNRGTCLSYNATVKFCSCSSGFGSDDCSVVPSATCASAYSSVSTTNIQFSPTAALSYNYPTLTVTVEAGLEETSWETPWDGSNTTQNVAPFSLDTTIAFGNGSFPDCAFPGPFWVQSGASAGSCFDSYVSQMSWSDARSRCGFVDHAGNKTFTQTVTVTRRYELPTLRDSPTLYRTESSTRQLSVIFPTYVDLGTSEVQVSGSADLMAAISSIDYNPTTELWTVLLFTSVQAPFKLETPHVISVTGELQTDNRFVTNSENVIDVVPCTNNSKNCLQQVSVSFGQGTSAASCTALTGTVLISFNVTCSEGMGTGCPATGAETSQVTITLKTGDTCPVTESIQFSVTTLTGYSEAALTTPRRSFLTASTAYFGAEISSTQAEISSRTVQPGSVCVELSDGNTGNPCLLVNYTTLAATNGKDPVFSVDLSQPTFASLASSHSQAEYVVRATVHVSFTGNSKKRAADVRTKYPDQPVRIAAVMTVTNTPSEPTTLLPDSGASATFITWTMLGSLMYIHVML